MIDDFNDRCVLLVRTNDTVNFKFMPGTNLTGRRSEYLPKQPTAESTKFLQQTRMKSNQQEANQTVTFFCLLSLFLSTLFETEHQYEYP